ncbi:MAG: hypothetical protein K0R27_286 [Xanthobacteraceae bacterium]|jgi:hypothetical protein|nr:hypothetical protein [Xanthobacteraceae bacterium]
MQPHTEPNCRILIPGQPIAAPRESVSEFVARQLREHEEKVSHLAQDIEDIVARQGSVKDEDLLTLGWSLPTLNELQDEALAIVRERAERRIS